MCLFYCSPVPPMPDGRHGPSPRRAAIFFLRDEDGIDTSESGRWEAEAREGGREPPCRDGRLVPWRILAAHPFRRSVVARALLLHPSVVSTAENASRHQDVSRRTPKGAIPRLSNCADGERQRREGLLALVRKRARLQEQEQPAGIFLLKTLKTFVGAGTCPIKIWEEDVQQSTAFTT